MQRFFVILILALLSGAVRAQTNAAQARTLSFDVVSIHENKNDTAMREYGATASGYHARAISPLLLLVTAYVPSDGKAGLFNPNQIEGMPDWMVHSRYEIEAKIAGEDLNAWQRPEVQRTMLQQMLAGRFKLTLHRDFREKPVYDLEVTKGGPKFKPSETSDMDAIRQKYLNATALPGGMAMVAGPNPGQRMLVNATIADLGVLLDKGIGRPIVDKTGLTGRYDFSLELDMSPGPDGTRPDPAVVLITALQEQLGLKLEPEKEKVEVLVIDHVERPSEN